MNKLSYLLVTLLFLAFPVKSAELILSNQGVTVTLTDATCDLPVTSDLGPLKGGNVVFSSGKRKLCWLIHEDHVDIVDEMGETPGPLPLDLFKAKQI